MHEERTETFSEEVSRLRREIAERQARLSFLVLGDQSKGVSISAVPVFRIGSNQNKEA